ncbi:MAG: histidine phosphatase family protein [Patescibacteria group bacterium]
MLPMHFLMIRHGKDQSKILMSRLNENPDDAEAQQELASRHKDDWPLIDTELKWAGQAGLFYEALLDLYYKSVRRYASPAARAFQTACSFLMDKTSGRNPWDPWIIDPNLHERSWGEQDMSWRQFQETYPKAFQKCLRDPFCFRPPFVGAESILDVRNLRAIPFMHQLERDCKLDDIAVAVTHVDWMLACQSYIEDIDPFQFKQMYPDPSFYPGHLDAIWYTRQDVRHPQTILNRFVFVKMIKFPRTDLDTALDINRPWRKIQPRVYFQEDLRKLVHG